MEQGKMVDMEARAKAAAGLAPTMMLAMNNDGVFMTGLKKGTE